MVRFDPPIFFVQNNLDIIYNVLILIIYYLINIGNNFVPDRKKIRIKDKKILPIILSIGFFYLFFSLLNRYTVLSDTFLP